MTPIERIIKEIESGTPTTGQYWETTKAILLQYERMVIMDAFYSGEVRLQRCNDIDAETYYLKLKGDD